MNHPTSCKKCILMLVLLVWITSCVSQTYTSARPSPESTVTVFGLVKTQGALKRLTWTEGMTLTHCIKKAGGFCAPANWKDVILIEPIERGNRVRMRKRYPKLDDKKAKTVKVRKGSIIIVEDPSPTF
jgi:protein involved in polysaccharide export with SLBB domain